MTTNLEINFDMEGVRVHAKVLIWHYGFMPAHDLNWSDPASVNPERRAILT